MALERSVVVSARRAFGILGTLLLFAALAVMFSIIGTPHAQQQLAGADRKAALRVQSQFLSVLSQQATASGDAGTGQALALHALPSPALGGDRDITPEAAFALYDGWLKNREVAVVAIGGRPKAISRDGSRVATASSDGTVRVWSVTDSNRQPIVLEGHRSYILHASFSPDGTRLATGSSDKTARLWDLTGDKPRVIVLGGDESGVSYVSFSVDGSRLVTLSRDARVWDLTVTPPTSTVFKSPRDGAKRAMFNPNGNALLICGRSALVYDLTRPSVDPFELKDDDGIAITYADFDRHNFLIGATSWRGKLHLLGMFGLPGRVIPAKPNITVIQAHAPLASYVAFGPDRNYLVTVAELPAREVKLWFLGGTEPRSILLDGHGDQGNLDVVRDVVFSPDGQRVLVASTDGTARIWDINHWSRELWDLHPKMPPSIILAGHITQVRQVAFTPDGRHVVTASEDGTARLWDVTPGGARAVALKAEQPQFVLATSTDTTHVVTADAQGVGRVWDLTAVPPRATVLDQRSGYRLNQAAFGSDTRQIVTVADDGTVRVWDLSSDTPQSRVLTGPTRGVSFTLLSPDGRRLLTGQYDQPTRIWDLSSDPPSVVSLEAWQPDFRPIAFSLDGKHLLSGSSRQGSALPRLTTQLWRLDSPNPRPLVLEQDRASILRALFSQDGRRLLVASGRSADTSLWELSEGAPRPIRLEGLGQSISAVAISRDGKHIIAGSHDGTARWLDLTIEPPRVVILRGHRRWIRQVAISPDGKRSITTAELEMARMWDLGGVAPRGFVLDALRAEFSPDGRRLLASQGATLNVYPHFPDTGELITAASRDLRRCLTDDQRERHFLPRMSADVDHRDVVPEPPCR